MTGPPPARALPAALAGERIDRVVAVLTGCSRAEAAAAVGAGSVRVDDVVVTKVSTRVEEGAVVEVLVDPSPPAEPLRADPDVRVPVVAADDEVIVVDKPAGMVVHPGPGHRGATMVNGLLAAFPELAEVGEPERPGLVHRLDGGTSGLLVVARTAHAHRDLVAQLAAHDVERVYSALVWGHPDHERGVIDAPIGRSRRNPLRMTVAVDGRDSRTRYEVERIFRDPADTSLLTCWLETGRTHQIRVHLSSVGHPVVGDALYGGDRSALRLPRPFLHAGRLSFRHPGSGQTVTYTSELPPELVAVLDGLG